jgi:ketosteroid isomerase-like protein
MLIQFFLERNKPMKKSTSIAVAIFAICLLAIPVTAIQGQTTGNAEQQIKALQAEFVKAELKADTSFYEKYYADNAVIVHSLGQIYTKAKEIAALKSGSLKYDSITVHNDKTEINGNTAIVARRVSAKGVSESGPFNQDFLVSVVWAKQQGDWKVVLRQSTRIPPGQ